MIIFLKTGFGVPLPSSLLTESKRTSSVPFRSRSLSQGACHFVLKLFNSFDINSFFFWSFLFFSSFFVVLFCFVNILRFIFWSKKCQLLTVGWKICGNNPAMIDTVNLSGNMGWLVMCFVCVLALGGGQPPAHGMEHFCSMSHVYWRSASPEILSSTVAAGTPPTPTSTRLFFLFCL
jgi:hypothetical protein